MSVWAGDEERKPRQLKPRLQAAPDDGGRAEGTCEVQKTGQTYVTCDACQAARNARWTLPNSCDTDVANSRSSARHACIVCGGSLDAGLTSAVVPQAPPPANLGRGSQEHGKVDDDVEDLIYSNECGIHEDFSEGNEIGDTAKSRTLKINGTELHDRTRPHWEVEAGI